MTPEPLPAHARAAATAALALALAFAAPGPAQAGPPAAADSLASPPADSLSGAAADPLARPPLSGGVEGAGAADSAAAPAPVAAHPYNARPVIVTRRVRLIGRSGNVVRTGPGSTYAIVGVYPKDASFTVLAKNGDWYDVQLSETESGWIHASLCREMDDLSGLEFRPNPKLYTRTGSYVLSAYSGAYAFDRKSNSLVLGGRFGYYVFDRLETEVGVSWTHVHRPQEIVESLFALSLEAEDFQMLFYNMNAVWEILPGRQVVPYAIGGVGSTLMVGRSEPSVNFGAGVRLFLSKRAATRWEVRDYRFQSGSGSSRVTDNNIEFTLGSEFLF